MNFRTNALMYCIRAYREHSIRSEQFAWLVAMLNQGRPPHKVIFTCANWVINWRTK